MIGGGVEKAETNGDGWDSYQMSVLWTEALYAIKRKSLLGLRIFMEGPNAPSAENPRHAQCVDFLLHQAAREDSAECVQYLAKEFGGEIHAAADSSLPTTLVQAIHCHEEEGRALMFNALMTLARSERVEEDELPWTSALRAAALAGDAVVFKHIGWFIGPQRFAKWTARILDSDGEDGWMIAARGGDPRIVAILMEMPEMRSALAQGNFTKGTEVADFAESQHSTAFAREIRGMVAAEREREQIEKSMAGAQVPSGGRASILRI